MDEDEQAIRAVIEERAAAVARGDVDGMTAAIADDATIFDIGPPLRSQGHQAAVKRARHWLSIFDGYPSWTDSEVKIVVGGETAFAHMISRVTGTLVTGAPADIWFRITLGFDKRYHGWWIVHEHASDPFDPESGKALVSLGPTG